jgi:hypothetical protein
LVFSTESGPEKVSASARFRPSEADQCVELPDAGWLIESPLFIESLFIEPDFFVLLCFIDLVPLFFMLSLDMLSFDMLSLLDIEESLCMEPCAGVVCGVVLGGVEDCCAKALPAASRQVTASEAIIVFVVRMFLPSVKERPKNQGNTRAPSYYRIVHGAI